MSVLLLGAVACMMALILSAWLMTFARWFPIEGIDGKFLVDYKTMIRAHVDYALMACLIWLFTVQVFNYLCWRVCAWRLVALLILVFLWWRRLTLNFGIKCTGKCIRQSALLLPPLVLLGLASPLLHMFYDF